LALATTMRCSRRGRRRPYWRGAGGGADPVLLERPREMVSDGLQSYEWDAAGRLKRVTGLQDLDVRYTYTHRCMGLSGPAFGGSAGAL
jgi:hypothetical protein